MDTTIMDSAKREYKALHEGATIRRLIGAAPLRVLGEDRVVFLQRLTTNDVKSLLPGQSVVTILTSPTAHILNVFTVIFQPESLLLLPASGRSDDLLQHLRGQIFFMDKVQVQPLEEVRIRVMGPLAGEKLAALDLVAVPTEDNSVRDDGEFLIVKQDTYDVPGYEIVGAEDAVAQLVEQLVDDGAVVLHNDDAYEVARIEQGRPAPGSELTERYNPLEIGMGWAYSQTKGCFTGQEILARQTNYDKVTKRLIGLTSQSPIAVGDGVAADGKTVGEVTSTAYSDRLNAHITLSVVRHAQFEPGTVVQVGTIDATVVELPFVSTAVN